MTAFKTLKVSVALASLLTLRLTAAESNDVRILLMDDFEGYTNTATLRSVWLGGSATLETNAPGGGHAALHDGGTMNNLTGLSVRPDSRYSVLFSVDFYDYATNASKRVTAILKNASGDSLEFGLAASASNPYAFRIFGFATPTDWIPFDPAFRSVPGWHRFQAIISLTNTLVTLDLNRDGVIDMALNLDGPPPAKPLKVIRFGGLGEKKNDRGPVLIDNVELALIPANQPIPAMAIHPPALVPVPNSIEPPPTPMVDRPTKPIQWPPVQQQPVTGPSTALWWIVGALGVIIGLLGALLLTLRRSTPAQSNGWAVTTTKPPGVLPGKGAADLTEFAKQSLVQGLYSQRQALMETQQHARHELAELESRLASLQLPLQERIRAYEKRINELEKQLESRGAEMQELTQVTLRLVREKLAEEKERQRTSPERFN